MKSPERFDFGAERGQLGEDFRHQLSGGPVRPAAERGEQPGEARVAGQDTGKATQRGQCQRRSVQSSGGTSLVTSLAVTPSTARTVDDNPRNRKRYRRRVTGQ